MPVVDKKILPTHLSMLITTRMQDDRMKPPVLNIIRNLQRKFPASHWMVTRHTVSMGRTM